ncbi:MAG: BON domain-containing protein [Acidimicrobiales bacterium]|jgi:osmotically-inducible protein OsmY
MSQDIHRSEIEDELDWLAMSPDVWCARETARDDEMLVDLVFDALADAEVAADCIAALDADKGIRHEAVKVKVVDGWVTLSGEVQDQDERRAAKYAVGAVDGILGISDHIMIASDDLVASEVVTAIKRAFRRSLFIDESLIRVTAAGDTVYLDGRVDSWDSMREAEDAAWAAPGVTKVVDRLAIFP